MTSRAVCAGVVLLITLGAGGPGALADHEGTEVGWWTRSPVASAPDGGVAVAMAPDGAVTVAAVRVTSGAPVRRLLFEAVEVGGVATDQASIAVCPTAGDWRVETGGSLADAPATSCESGVSLARDGPSAIWSADVTTLATTSEVISVALVPGVPTGTAAAFEVRLAHPRLVIEVAEPAATDDNGETDNPDATTAASEAAPPPVSIAEPPSFSPPPAQTTPSESAAPPPASASESLTEPASRLPISVPGDDKEAAAPHLIALSLLAGAATVAIRKAPGRPWAKLAPRSRR